MEKADVILAIQKLNKAYESLKAAVLMAKDELHKDGVIQRFEFTAELLWKTLKIVLEYNKIECEGPRSCVKKAFKYGYIEDDDLILDILEDRNKSSHIYDEKTSEEIFQRIKNVYLLPIDKIISNVKAKNL
ncbi:MAG: nucleotidyltransferase substrate binding protein [Elusimicrobia bacterium]|nr:nucleotidyltransferase substrate binding protein [Elusimicrobiota bacterium]